MKTPHILIFDILLITALLCITGEYFEKSVFVSLGTFLSIFGITWLIGIIVCLPLRPIQYSILAAFLSIGSIVSGMVCESISPAPVRYFDTLSVDDQCTIMGMHPDAEWQIMITYEDYSGQGYEIVHIVGDSLYATEFVHIAEKAWDIRNPDKPLISVLRCLTWIPIEHARSNNYPMMFTERH